MISSGLVYFKLQIYIISIIAAKSTTHKNSPFYSKKIPEHSEGTLTPSTHQPDISVNSIQSIGSAPPGFPGSALSLFV